MRLPTYREDQYDVTYSSWVSLRFQSQAVSFYSTDGASSKHKNLSQNSPFNAIHWFLALFVG
jgi:hypothetical protein